MYMSNTKVCVRKYALLTLFIFVALHFTDCRDLRPDIVVWYDSSLSACLGAQARLFKRRFPDLKTRFTAGEAPLLLRKALYGDRCDILLSPTLALDKEARALIAAKHSFANDKICLVSAQETTISTHDIRYRSFCIAQPVQNSATARYVREFLGYHHAYNLRKTAAVLEPNLVGLYVQKGIAPLGLITQSEANRAQLKIILEYAPKEPFYSLYRFEKAPPAALAFENFLFSSESRDILRQFGYLPL